MIEIRDLVTLAALSYVIAPPSRIVTLTNDINGVIISDNSLHAFLADLLDSHNIVLTFIVKVYRVNGADDWQVARLSGFDVVGEPSPRVLNGFYD